MKTYKILDFMVKDHAVILDLLGEIEKNIGGDFEILLKSFNSFEWCFEKHIFVEERAIFASVNPINLFEKYPIIPELLEEHLVLLDCLSKIRKDLLRKKRIDFSKFKNLLINHKNFEEKNVYPNLDQELDNSQKNSIFERINEFS